MSRKTAQIIAQRRLRELKGLPYRALAEMIDHTLTAEESGPDGGKYQIEIQAFWDGKKGGNIRVMVAVDGGEVSAFRPFTDSFIVAADGSFVGENLC